MGSMTLVDTMDTTSPYPGFNQQKWSNMETRQTMGISSMVAYQKWCFCTTETYTSWIMTNTDFFFWCSILDTYVLRISWRTDTWRSMFATSKSFMVDAKSCNDEPRGRLRRASWSLPFMKNDNGRGWPWMTDIYLPNNPHCSQDNQL